MPNTTATLDAKALDGQFATDHSSSLKIILSFDIEEHFRIEAAAGLACQPRQMAHYRERLDISTRHLLDLLAETGTLATFFIVGEIAEHNPALIRRIARDGHEVASHGWDHRRIHHFNAASFREDVRRSKEALENLTSAAVVGYRAPTFSLMRETAWALDVLADLGMIYDSSVYPVRHDRYGAPAAPRSPFLARGERRELLELPPMTLRLCALNFPMGGGGYFRLFPLFLTKWALRQTANTCRPAVANLYFHPWEFDSEQERLPLSCLARFRTYVGIRRNRGRLLSLLASYPFVRAVDVAREMQGSLGSLPTFALNA